MLHTRMRIGHCSVNDCSLPFESTLGYLIEDLKKRESVERSRRPSTIMLTNHTYPPAPPEYLYEGHSPLESSTPSPLESVLQGPSQQQQQEEDETSQGPNMIIVGSLIGLIAILSLLLVYLLIPPLLLYIKRRTPVNPKQLEARYATIEGWLISKVGFSMVV